MNAQLSMHATMGADKIGPRIAVIGCGYWGKNLVRNFAELGALEALVDTNEDRVRDLIGKHGGRTSTFEEALQDAKIDGIAIAAPASMHFTLARAALEAGKHVFVEKPIALNLAEAEVLCALASQHDRRLMVGHLLQYHPAFLKLQELVRTGSLGRLQYLYSSRLNFGLIRREEDVLWSFAPHDLSMILCLVGNEPSEVDAFGSYHLHPAIADVTITHLEFPSGERSDIFVSWLHPFKEQKLIVVGDAGMAVFNDGEPWDRKLVIYPHKIAWQGGVPDAVKVDGSHISVVPGEPLHEECRHFLHCIATGSTPRTDGAEGLRVLSVLKRASSALKKAGTTVSSPSPAQQFSGVMIHESSYVDDDVVIGLGTRIWHFSHILGKTRIGKNVTIGQNVMIGPDVTIGDNCKIQNNVSIYAGVTLEENVFCGPSCVFTNVHNPRAEIERKTEFRSTLVQRGTSIGANATIVCGTTLGRYSFIGAGSVVTRDVPAFAMMAGVPARRIAWISRAGHRLSADLICPLTGERYYQNGPETIEEATLPKT